MQNVVEVRQSISRGGLSVGPSCVQRLLLAAVETGSVKLSQPTLTHYL